MDEILSFFHVQIEKTQLKVYVCIKSHKSECFSQNTHARLFAKLPIKNFSMFRTFIEVRVT